MALSEWAQRQVASRPIEATIVRKVYHAAQSAYLPITSVDWGEGEHPVSNVSDLLEYAFDVDEITLYSNDGSFVGLVMGEGYDIISDYSLTLSATIDPIIDWVIASDV